MNTKIFSFWSQPPLYAPYPLSTPLTLATFSILNKTAILPEETESNHRHLLINQLKSPSKKV